MENPKSSPPYLFNIGECRDIMFTCSICFYNSGGIAVGVLSVGSTGIGGTGFPPVTSFTGMEVDMKTEGTIYSPDTSRKERVPPGQHLTDRWPVLHYGSVPKINTFAWTLKIFGKVEKAKTLSYDEFMSLPMVRVFSDIHCVTTWSRLNNLWDGVSTSELKKLVNISPEAKFVIIHGVGGFTTNLTTEDFFQPDVLFVVNHDNEPISADHGGPVRLVVPRLYFWKSAKWVTAVEFLEKDRPGFWESHGYHNHGDPWTEERYGR